MNPLDLKHQHFKYLWFDADFAHFHKLVKDLYDTIRGIERRFQRRESTQVAESVFNYIEKRDMLYYTPQVFHDYIDDDVRICVASKIASNQKGRYIRSFYVQIRGFSLSKDDFAFIKRTYHATTSDGFTVGEFDTLEDAVDVFRWIIKFHLNQKLEMLF